MTRSRNPNPDPVTARAHKRIAEITETLSEFDVSGPDCRRINSALTPLVAVDLAAVEHAVEFMGNADLGVGVADVIRLLRTK